MAGAQKTKVGEVKWGWGVGETWGKFGPYLKPWGVVSQLCRHLPKYNHCDGICDDSDGAWLEGCA